MILQIEDFNGQEVCALEINEYDENVGGPRPTNNIRGNINIADIDFDDIFDTNQYKIRLQLNSVNNKHIRRHIIAEAIADDIVTCRQDEIYDDEILCMYVNDYFENEMDYIRTIVDEIIRENHLADDNLTIINR